jgi:hypothetical protein
MYAALGQTKELRLQLRDPKQPLICVSSALELI